MKESFRQDAGKKGLLWQENSGREDPEHGFCIDAVRARGPAVHCLTNYVTAGSVANIILAAGGSPIMSDHPEETAQVAAICDSLLLNVGTLKPTSTEAMISAGRIANELGHPVLLDPVGIGSSAHRLKTAEILLNQVSCQVVRGNASEIRLLAARLLPSLACGRESEAGVGIDARHSDQLTQENLKSYVLLAKQTARALKAVTVITGAADIVTDGKRSFLIRNGHPMMTRITGAGCMLDGLISVFLASSRTASAVSSELPPAGSLPARRPDFTYLTAIAVAFFGLCGETAYEKTVKTQTGTASFQTFLIDAVSMATDDFLKRGIKIEII